VIVLSQSTRRFLVVLVAVLSIAVSSGGSENLPSDIQVALSSSKALTLIVTVRSRSQERVTLATWRLPWGNRNSMLLAPVNTDGVCVANRYYVEEYPNYNKVSIEPNASISGEIDLKRVIPELGDAVKKTDVHLFWAYRAPEELHIGGWSGGWILIPQQQ